MPEAFVIIDIGKTNIRAILADLTARQELAVRRMENHVLPGPPYPHLDVKVQAAFIISALTEFAALARLTGVMVIGHGATVALVDDSGLVLPVLDYEFSGPDELAAEYDRLRPDFALTGSPRMPGGLNIGAQLHWLRRCFPERVAQARQALFWPQYWTWWLTGRAVSEISYATSHADLWSLADGTQVDGMAGGLFPALASAWSVAGTLRKDLAAAHGLPADLTVHVGAHDSSLALVPHAGRGRRAPSVAMSTGTWLTAFAIGVEAMPPKALPGVMASLDIFGQLVPNFRFMAGKARADILAAPVDLAARPAETCRIEQDPATGQFRLLDKAGRPARPDGDSPAAGLDRLLAGAALDGMRAIGARGPVHVTGPFAANADFIGALQRGWNFPVNPRSYEQSLVDQVASLFDEAQG
ncbi:FGGY family carbohydrate kinase [Paracoccus xiamenensis]|uniref:FGGY family carbohydrate kinase n=1 Tax=Paracoccus xiamenensis TaxID=2714901 RepID=UPI0014087B37|nr:FGGY family carbohydrate kinase [Paracoccus xiamenensis]NHF72331.1 hypothetical protein [Paracoccus xiamenensis]